MFGPFTKSLSAPGKVHDVDDTLKLNESHWNSIKGGQMSRRLCSFNEGSSTAVEASSISVFRAYLYIYTSVFLLENIQQAAISYRVLRLRRGDEHQIVPQGAPLICEWMW